MDTLTVDALSAVFALTCAHALFKTAKGANKIRKAKFNVCDVVWDALNANQLPGSGHAECCNIPDDLRRVLYMNHHSHLGFGVFMFAIGVMALLVSNSAFMIMTHPGVVWVPVVVMLITMAVWLSVNELRRNPYIYEGIPFMSGRIARRNQRYVEGLSGSVQKF